MCGCVIGFVLNRGWFCVWCLIFKCKFGVWLLCLIKYGMSYCFCVVGIDDDDCY